MPVSEQRVSGLVVVVAFYCVFVFFFSWNGGMKGGLQAHLLAY